MCFTDLPVVFSYTPFFTNFRLQGIITSSTQLLPLVVALVVGPEIENAKLLDSTTRRRVTVQPPFRTLPAFKRP